MLQHLSRFLSALWGDRFGNQPRRFAPTVAPLEDRVLLQFSSNSFTVTPNILWPPDGRYVPVVLSGSFNEFATITLPKGQTRIDYGQLPGPKEGSFQIIDEYRRTELTGPLTLTNNGGGHYSFQLTVYLQAQRSTEFVGGRHYYITTAAHDSDGWTGSTLPVWVPVSKPPPPKPPSAGPSAQVASHGHHAHHGHQGTHAG